METQQSNQSEITTPQPSAESSKKPISERVANLLNFLKKPENKTNPDQALAAIAVVPDENIPLPKEHQELLNQANSLLETLGRGVEIVIKVKDNELARSAFVAVLGLISTLALGQEAQLITEAATIGIGSIGGGGKEALKKVAVGAVGIVGSQGVESLAGQGIDSVVDIASGFVDSGRSVAKDFVNESIKTAGRKAIELGRNRMMRIPAKT